MEEITNLLAELHARVDGLNAPASAAELSRLQHELGHIPRELALIYRDHNGSMHLPSRGSVCLTARLMPIDEVLEENAAMNPIVNDLGSAGPLTLFWTDDNSNYCGVYTDGPLRGWLTCLDHEEPMLTPAFRSVTSFLKRLLAWAPGISTIEPACDLPSIPKEIPTLIDDPQSIESDRNLASNFRHRFETEQDEDLRRLYAFCAIGLTPVADTAQVLSFLFEDDMWTPAAAVHLLELRRYQGGISELERLATSGLPNGDSAAMRQLVRLQANEAREAIARLKAKLTGQKLQQLEFWIGRRASLLSPRWR